MGATKNYNRPKSTVVNSTGIIYTVLASESPDAPSGVAVTSGNTGTLSGHIQADADESGGNDVQDLWKLSAAPALDADGKHRLTVTVTPVNGSGVDYSGSEVKTMVVEHPQNMDVWQADAGRARQA